GPNRPFRDLAGGLASRGVAVLRYDKRTRLHGARMAAGDIGLEEEVVADALMALDTLRHTPGVDPRAVFLLGHSMGAFMAPMIAERDARLAGAILLAGNTGSTTELTAEQLRYIASLQGAPSPELQAMIATVDSLREGRLPESALVLGAPARYWHELDALRPIEVARRIKTPLLILQGGRDYQVPPRELGIWRGELAGRPHTDFHEFPALNHLFMAGSGPSSPAEYQVPGHVDAAVVDEIASWILGARTEKR
ncbi:MAG TPA: alpha/beta fold hydrolase, partial [Longimicrobiales bacterium]